VPARPFVQSPASCGIQDWHTSFGGALGGWQHHAGHGLQRTLYIMQAHCLRPEPGARAQELPERLLGTVRFSRLDLAAGWYLQGGSSPRLWRSRQEAAAAGGGGGMSPQAQHGK